MYVKLCPECHSRFCDHAPLPARPLSPRQRSILRLLQLGLSNKEIGEELGLTTDTVKVYASQHIYPLIGVTTRLEAALWATHHPDLVAA